MPRLLFATSNRAVRSATTRLDASTNIECHEPGAPEKGCASVCLNCGQLLIYDADLRLQKATVRDIGDLMTENPKAWAMIEQAQILIRQRGRFR